MAMRTSGLWVSAVLAAGVAASGVHAQDSETDIFADDGEAQIFSDPAQDKPRQTGPRTGFEGQLDEVKVTARKREESLHKTPVAGTVLSGEDISALVVESASDLFRFVPGATTPTVGPESMTDLVIRGQGGGRSETSETATGIYKNGIYVAGGARGGRFYNLIDMFDIDRFEVLRGPQGGSYGRNAVGGAVNISTKKPGGEFGGFVTADLNSVLRVMSRAAVDIPFDGDRFGLRAGLFYMRQFDGHITNSDGSTLDKMEALGGRATLAFDSQTGLSGWLIGEFLTQESPGIATYGYVQGSDFDEYERDLNTRSLVERDEWSLTGKAEYELGFGVVTGVGGIRGRKLDYIDDFDGWNSFPLSRLGGAGTLTTVVNLLENQGVIVDDALENQLAGILDTVSGSNPLGPPVEDTPLSEIDDDIVQDIVYEFSGHSAELRIASFEGQSRFKWVAGVEYIASTEDIDFEITGSDVGTLNVETVPGSGIFLPVPIPTGEFLKNLDIVATLDFYSIAGFGLLGYDIGQWGNITVESRYTFDHKEIDSVSTETGVVTPAETKIARESEDFTNFSPVATANVFVGDWLTIYGRYATAYRAGGFNFFTVPDIPDSIRFREETSESFEAGLKFRLFSRKLQIDLAAFYMETEDIQVIDRTPQQEIFIFNAGDAFVEGIEVDIKYYQPLPAINSVFYGFAGGVIGRSEFLRGQIENGGQTLDLTGKTVPRARSFSASLVGVFATRLWGETDLRTVVTYTGQWGGYENPQNTQELDDFHLVDARLGLTSPGWRVGLYVQNLFQNQHAVEKISNTLFLNQRRTYGLEGKVEF